MWQQMTADQMREWLTLHCHLPLTLSSCLSTSHSGMFSEVLARVVLCLECPVILLNYSSFESHLQAPLCETRARLPLRFHAPLFSLVTACPGLASQNPSRIQKLFDLPGMSSRPESDPLLGLRGLLVTPGVRCGVSQAQAGSTARALSEALKARHIASRFPPPRIAGSHCACACSRGLKAKDALLPAHRGQRERQTQNPKLKRMEPQKPKERGEVKQGAGLRRAMGFVAWSPSGVPEYRPAESCPVRALAGGAYCSSGVKR